MAKADAEDRLAAVDQFADLRHRVGAVAAGRPGRWRGRCRRDRGRGCRRRWYWPAQPSPRSPAPPDCAGCYACAEIHGDDPVPDGGAFWKPSVSSSPKAQVLLVPGIALGRKPRRPDPCSKTEPRGGLKVAEAPECRRSRPARAEKTCPARRRHGCAGSAALVSTPLIPGRFTDFSQSSKCRSAGGWTGRHVGPAAPGPASAAVAVSTSLALAPTLPICGKVKVMDLTGIRRIGHDLLITGH